VKATSLKDMESYIYSAVMIPLKSLDMEPMWLTSPLIDKAGYPIEFTVQRERVSRNHFDHNYQAEEARLHAKMLVFIHHKGRVNVAADYSKRRHNVRIYPEAFAKIERGSLLLNKFREAFETHSPFNQVVQKRGLRGGEMSADVAEQFKTENPNHKQAKRSHAQINIEDLPF